MAHFAISSKFMNFKKSKKNMNLEKFLKNLYKFANTKNHNKRKRVHKRINLKKAFSQNVEYKLNVSFKKLNKKIHIAGKYTYTLSP